jgi:hypothetical protein
MRRSRLTVSSLITRLGNVKIKKKKKRTVNNIQTSSQMFFATFPFLNGRQVARSGSIFAESCNSV